eukprot:7391770-Prymnesium_polylepis.5
MDAVNIRLSVGLGRLCATGMSSASHAVNSTGLSTPTVTDIVAALTLAGGHSPPAGTRPQTVLAVREATFRLTGTV